MEIYVEKISKEEWAKFAKSAHQAVFEESWNEELERIDYALLTTDENKNIIQYATIRELDAETAYLQYGGSFPNYRNSIYSYRSFKAILSYLYANYKWVSFLTENTNLSMLKFGIKEGFVIVGMRNFKGKILLEHLKGRE